MQFSKLFDDDRAVSPVIGVILMVAITVILAAVIGTFVLGLGDQVQSTTPQASFGFDSENLGNGDADDDKVTITHESGDSIDTGSLSVKIGSTSIYDGSDNSSLGVSGWGGDSVSAGDSLVANESDGSLDVSGEQTIRVIYNNPDSDSSSTLGSKTYTFD